MKSLIIDPGHGGTDSGAVGFFTKEKEWTFVISLYQYERLKELGANVALTRNRDRTLDSSERVGLIKDKYDFCMSNHFNAFNGEARGVEVIHSIHSTSDIASRIARAIVETSNLPLRRVFSRKGSDGRDYYFIHRLTGKTESVIVEYGFIDNKIDNDYYANVNNFFQVAEAVVKVWCEILGVPYKERVKKEPKTTIYKVQVGAFKDKNNAETMARRLQADGYPAIIVK